MTKTYLLLLALIILLAGCGPKTIVDETADSCRPKDLRAEVNDGTMTVVWDVPCTDLNAGYFIYIQEEPLVAKYPGPLPDDIKPFNHTPFPGDKEPNDGVEHFDAEGLSNGVEYFVSVRMVLPDRSLSKPSEEITVVCGPRGETELSIRYKSDNDGFSLAENRVVRADALENDLYFFSKDGVDYLVSPVRLDGFLRRNTLKKISAEAATFEAAAKIKTDSEDTRVEVSTGDHVLLRTADGGTGLIRVIGFTGTGTERTVRLEYSFRPDAP